MSNTKTVMGQASNQYVAPTDITDVFSTYLYTGTGSAQTITNGIDLDGEGGLVWIKDRSTTEQHVLTDTERGATKFIKSNSTGDEQTNVQALTAFNSNGFSIGNYADVNQNTDDFASWTFRKAPKFFDVVTYTGDGTNGRAISHNLGSTPGCIIIKCTAGDTRPWAVYHRGVDSTAPEDYFLQLNETAARINDFYRFADTAPTDSVFSVGSSNDTNGNGNTYVAYLFAHNDSDGGFGPDGDQDIIKCGSYTGNGSSDGPEIDLGFEPQWVMVKNATATGDWTMYDNMRGAVTGTTGSKYLHPNKSDAEATRGFSFLSNGFQPRNTGTDSNSNGQTYIYIAIRRGPLAPPESATEVFAIDHLPTTTTPKFTASFAVDMALQKEVDRGESWYNASRLTQGKYLVPQATDAEATSTNFIFDYNNGWSDQGGDNWTSWMWKRAPGYFDVVAYTGNSTAGRTVSHNLGVAPEMMWVKSRDATTPWAVYHKDIGNTKSLRLNDTNASATENFWNGTTPTADTFTLGANGEVNYPSSRTYIAYLFASLPGISKVGSVSHTGGSATNVDCGFTAGCRFLILKRTDAVSDWWVFDTVRGITSGNDARLLLNSTSAETSTDQIDPYSAGFTIDGNRATGEYIFYAIA